MGYLYIYIYHSADEWVEPNIDRWICNST